MQQRLDAAGLLWAITDSSTTVQHNEAPVHRPGAAEGTRLVGGVLTAQAVAYVAEKVRLSKQNNADTLISTSASQVLSKERMLPAAARALGKGCMHALLAHQPVCADQNEGNRHVLLGELHLLHNAGHRLRASMRPTKRAQHMDLHGARPFGGTHSVISDADTSA